MSRRRLSREQQNNEVKLKPGAKKQVAIMVISVVLMVFSVIQVYHLARYTFGLEVKQDDLKVYRWVCMLLHGNTAIQ